MRNSNAIKKILITISIILVCLLVGTIGFSYIYLSSMKTNSKDINLEASPAKGNEVVNFLVTGVDIGSSEAGIDNAAQRTDTIMVISYDPSLKTIKVISIPRDTKIKINGKNAKINSSVPIGGAKYLADSIENMMGININYYMQVDYTAFRNIIDAIGGIDVNIENEMNYDDPAQNLHIHFTKGSQHLDGQKAEEFFRWRKNNDGTGFAEGDIGRIKSQHNFIEAVVQKLKTKRAIFKLPAILKAIAKNTKTNMSASEIVKYGSAALKVNKNNITMSTIKGTSMYINGVSYFVYNSKSNNQTVDDKRSPETSNADIKNLKVEILNGTEINGLAKKYRDKLIKKGFSDITTGNASKKPVKETRATLYGIDEGSASEVKSKLGIENAELVNNKAQKYDIIIIIGEDFKE
ncbi:LCP family protein [Clostridium guangxiense]|uniref:LCP family protein n=1 Tax=Clostridium guangxiense TaxID=1662055 RepID=UPI001E5EFD10|nr:LCP family protein [Clostridium guangxiense]